MSQSIAEEFAKALDRDDFDTARNLLANDCRYLINDDVFVGPEAIIQSYQDGSDKARRLFDQVEYGSEVSAEGTDRFVIKFWDRLEIGGHSHTYSLLQHLTLDADSQIVRIEHEELPGEREALERFMNEHGISKDS